MLDGAARRLIGPALDAARRGAGAARRHRRCRHLCGLRARPRGGGRDRRGVLRGSGLPSSWRAASATGSTARWRGTARQTDRGGFLDIVLDFAFYGADPARLRARRARRRTRSPARCCSSASTSTARASSPSRIMAEKRGLVERGARTRSRSTSPPASPRRPRPSPSSASSACCPTPSRRSPIVFAALSLVTAAARIALAIRCS